MTWVRVDADVADRPEVWELCEALGLSVPEAVGLFVMLTGAVARRCQRGAIDAIPDGLLERWVAWSGERGAFARVVRERLSDANGRLVGWDEANGILDDRRERDRIAKARQRARGRGDAPDVEPTSEGHPQDVAPTSAPTNETNETNEHPSTTAREASQVREQLPHEHHRLAFDQLLAAAPNPEAVIYLLRGEAAGMGGPARSWDQIGQGIADLVANGKHEQFNARQVRRYIADAIEEPAVTTRTKAAPRGGSATDATEAERAFDDALRFMHKCGGFRHISAEAYHTLPEPTRRGLAAAGGFKALSDADEIGLRMRRKEFITAYLNEPATAGAAR